MVNLRSMRWAVLVAALMLGATHSAWAAVVTDIDSATVVVDPTLSIVDEIGSFTLTFNVLTGSSAGSISTGQTVGYLVASNSMPNAALPGAITARISALLPNIDFRGTTDATSYLNDGLAANAILTAVNTNTAAPTVIGTLATSMYDKPASMGTAGKILKGRAFINWNARAVADLVPGDGGVVTLTVTLKDV